MKVGYYVRTNEEIGKTINCPEQLKESYGKWLWFETSVEQRPINKKEVVKSSPNIIDLIEEGDILKLLDVQYGKEYKAEVILDYNDNLCVIDFENNKIIDLKESLFKKDIKLLSILTKEQFESMEYKVGD